MRCANSWRLFAVALLVAASGCANTDLGQIDETRDERDDMSGPGIFADESGETRLKWELGGGPPESGEASPAAAVDAPEDAELDEQAEFELFKEWKRMRAEGRNSPEYREFLQWLEFREFKAAE